jgi:RimJ/RimL family protein N-acetyltransferase
VLTLKDQLLTDGVVSLREILPEDEENLYRWRMDPLSRSMFRNTEEAPYELHRSMIEQYFQPGSRDCWFIIEAEQTPVGALALYNFDDQGLTCEYGRFVIAPDVRRRGYGRRALRLLMDYAHSAGIRRVRCEVLSSNTGALRLYRELGFVQEAEHREGARSFLELSAEPGACV